MDKLGRIHNGMTEIGQRTTVHIHSNFRTPRRVINLLSPPLVGELLQQGNRSRCFGWRRAAPES